MCTVRGNCPEMMPANNGVPVPTTNTPGFPPAFEPRNVQAAHGNRFGFVPSPAGPWQPQVNGVLSSSVPAAQHDARAPPLQSTATPFLQQHSRPPPLSSVDAGLQNAKSAQMSGGPPPAIRASPAQVLLVLFIGAV